MNDLHEIQHTDPCWAQRADFVIAANIEDGIWKTKYQYEQLAAQQISEDHFIICCIPFALYDIGLGDTVVTDGEFLIQSIVTKGDYLSYRFATKSSKEQNTVIQRLKLEHKTLVEVYSEKLTSLAVKGTESGTNIVKLLDQYVSGGIINDYEALNSK